MQIEGLALYYILAISVITMIVFFVLGFNDIRWTVFLLLLTPVITSLFFKNEERWLNEELETGFEGYIRGAIIIYCAMIGIITFFRKWYLHKGKIAFGYLFFILFVILAFSSIIYTVDTKYTTIRSIFLFGVFLFVLGLDKWIENEDKLEAIMNVLYYAAIVFIVLSLMSLAVPARSWWWRTPRFIGLLSEPNITGAYFMLSYPILLWKFYNTDRSNKRLIITFIFLAFVLHLLTGSRTTLISSLLGISVFLLIKRKIVKLVSVAGIVSLLVIVIFFIYTPENLERGEEGTVFTVTGREVLWQGALYRFTQKPLLGWGYMVESKILTMRSMQGTFSLATAQQPLHNGYLSILSGTGLLGLLLWLSLTTYPLVKNARKRLPDFINYKAYFVSTSIMVFTANFTESFLTGYIGNGGDLFFWVSWVVALKVSEFSVRKDYVIKNQG